MLNFFFIAERIKKSREDKNIKENLEHFEDEPPSQDFDYNAMEVYIFYLNLHRKA